jgi:hypothetical protein
MNLIFGGVVGWLTLCLFLLIIPAHMPPGAWWALPLVCPIGVGAGLSGAVWLVRRLWRAETPSVDASLPRRRSS